MRLTDLLEQRWADADRVWLRQLVDAGHVRVNGLEPRLDARVAEGDVVTVEFPTSVRRRRIAVPADTIEVLAESETCVAVAKPAGVPSIPDRSGREAGALGLVSAARPGDDLRIAHRLDRDTSGCLVFARGVEAARWLDRCFRERTVRKEYLAVVEGSIARDRVEIRRALGPDPRRPGYVTVVPDGAKRSRDAATDAEVVERFRDHTYVRLLPHTGRGHQLRAHLRSIGHPIVGDTKYGASGPLMMSKIKRGYKARTGAAEVPLLERMFLHAASIEIPMPDGGTFAARAPLPDDLERALDKLRKFAADRGGARWS